MKKILILASLIIILSSCDREIECGDPPINLNFIGFSQSSLDTIVIRKFSKESNFQNQIDSIQATSRNSTIVNTSDTASLNLGDIYRNPRFGFDWQIFIPSINRTIYLTEITKQEKTGSCSSFASDCFCEDEITGLKVDNQLGILQDSYYYRLFIR